MYADNSFVRANWRVFVKLPIMAVMLSALIAAQSVAFAQETAASAPPPDLAKSVETLNSGSSSLRIALDTVWVLVTAMLVFWMNAGFALVESGLCRAKNCANARMSAGRSRSGGIFRFTTFSR